MLIGLAGPKRSGKSTLAAGLCESLGLAEDSWAGPIRRFVADTLGWTMDELEARKEAPIHWLGGVTARQMMQTVGTEWGRRMVHGDLWLRSLFMRIPAEGAVISDCRFPNEAQAILDRGGMVIQLSRPGTGEGDAHASELPLPPELVSVRLVNDGTPAQLIERALAAISARKVH